MIHPELGCSVIRDLAFTTHFVSVSAADEPQPQSPFSYSETSAIFGKVAYSKVNRGFHVAAFWPFFGGFQSGFLNVF
jgi:hypothetical protein